MHGRPQITESPCVGRSNLRLPKHIVRSIDIARGRRPGFMSRNSWIAEAVIDKLKQEGIDVPPDPGGADDA